MDIINSRKFFINPDYINLSQFIKSLPDTFCKEGEIIRNIRNEMRLIKTEKHNLVVKSYKVPNFINKIAYCGLRKSKAERAYKYANLLLSKGISTPIPVAYITEKKNGLFYKSYFISLLSECPNNYYDLFEGDFERKHEILESIAKITAKMHENNFLHQDYTGGNILFNDGEKDISVELIDLNRMSFRKIDMKVGCKNFSKLRATENMLEIMAKEYAKVRGYDEELCFSLIKKHNISWKQNAVNESLSIKIFAFYYKNTPVLIQNDMYYPVMAGNASVGSTSIQGDDAGDNISDKNKNYSELTGIYWVWRNTVEDIVGCCHYRRYFTKTEPFLYKLKRLLYIPIGLYKKRYGLIYTSNTSYFLPRILDKEEIYRLIGDYDAILPQARKLRYTVKEHYNRYHNIKDLHILESIIAQKYPDYLEAFRVTLNSKRLYANNMFILHNKHFQEFMKWLFDILFEFEKKIELKTYTDYQERILGFIAERLLNVWFSKQRLKVLELPIIYFKNQKNESSEK